MVLDCRDSKEIPCSLQETMEPTCVSELQLCDGIINCPGGSDENDCAIGKLCWSVSRSISKILQVWDLNPCLMLWKPRRAIDCYIFSFHSNANFYSIPSFCVFPLCNSIPTICMCLNITSDAWRNTYVRVAWSMQWMTLLGFYTYLSIHMYSCLLAVSHNSSSHIVLLYYNPLILPLWHVYIYQNAQHLVMCD